MAIKSDGLVQDQNQTTRSSSNTSALSSCRLVKISFTGREGSSSGTSNKLNYIKEKSPYLANDKVQVLNRVVAKKPVKKPPTEINSSFPLAVSVYKANSDEFKKSKKDIKKVKKSVLTLPNEPAPVPKMYTVSDVNDSECFNEVNQNKAKKPKKRRTTKRYMKPRRKDPTMEYYDRDARYCSQLNIDLDCSSSEAVNYNGDGEGFSKFYKSSNSAKDASDVWAVLRDIKNFPFRTSPPESQDSVVPLRKRRPMNKNGNGRNDTRIIETCRTEEISYISSFEFDSRKSHGSFSPSSSFDRITVIDKHSDQEILTQLSQKIFGTNINSQSKVKSNTIKQNPERIKYKFNNSNKNVIQNKKKKEKKQIASVLNDKISQSDLKNENNVISDISKFSCEIEKPKICPNIDRAYIKEIQDNNLADNTFKLNQLDNGDEIFDQKASNKNPSQNVTPIKLSVAGNPGKQINGITRVILSDGQNIVSSKIDNFAQSPRKPRLAFTFPNNNMPKQTLTEIKRRLANLKFPIVVLGKDQLTDCGIKVPNYDSPQFNGLDQQIWPFMIEWCEKKPNLSSEKKRKNEIIPKLKNSELKNKLHHPDNLRNNEMVQKTNNYDKKRIETIRNTQKAVPEVAVSKVQSKPKPIHMLKNKMYQLFHRNPNPIMFRDNKRISNNPLEKVQKLKIVNEKTGDEFNRMEYKTSTNLPPYEKQTENSLVKKSYSPLKHPWAKTKWTNDFIDNIIKKIKCGVYYGEEEKESKKKINGTEVCTQTEVLLRNACCQNSDESDFTPNLKLSNINDPLKDIPGFDKTLPTLEIKTINKSKIAVKHCITNVVVQFDIQILTDANNMINKGKSISCFPIYHKNNQEKVFKCNTSILNATLPAELCTILPNMMRNILKADRKLSLRGEKLGSHLSAISEFGSPELFMHSIGGGQIISDDLRQMINGGYRYVSSCPKVTRNVNLSLTADGINHLASLLPILNAQTLSLCEQNSITSLCRNNLNIFEDNAVLRANENQTTVSTSTCMALQPYEERKFSIVPYRGIFDAMEFMKEIVTNINTNIYLKSNCIQLRFCDRREIYTNVNNANIATLPSFITNGIISLFNTFNTNNDNDCAIGNCTMNVPKQISTEKKEGRPIKVLKKNSYGRCYRKCNSMSNISNNKCISLTKITNLEEFCQVLGSNCLSSVLAGCLEKKILEALGEMKNWITEISPKQALLVLLLTNKKDNPTLIRFRPILLQGIAVNRITRAIELDTEIEVIERESSRKSSQYEEFSYLSHTTQNQDNLLEELYWIAKTTASDYQKTFDESSEKLLKSLLEKRKKLNPSYLRVMARYVGLGLLKPTK